MSRYDVAIIGGGPSGLAAATYTTGFQLETVIIAPDLGGKVNYDFRLQDQTLFTPVWGLEATQAFAKQVQESAVTHETAEVNQVNKSDDGLFHLALSTGETIVARVVIVATGAKPQRLYVPGEQEYWGSGLSFSAVSHAPLFVDRTVAVVGNTKRTEIAILKLATVAQHIYWVSSTTHEATELHLRQLENHPKVTPLFGWEVQRVIGHQNVTGIEIAAGYSLRTIAVDGVFVEMGLIPNIEFIRGLIDFDPETGHIPVNQRCETALPGLFAAGDVTDVYSEQITVALGEGVKAAISAWEYLATNE
ncbi:MAG: NAD(P)/FAD-dependent oxidoreductase [Caldilineaceae bacterium]